MDDSVRSTRPSGRAVALALAIAPLAAPPCVALMLVVGGILHRLGDGVVTAPSLWQAVMLCVAVFLTGAPVAYAAAAVVALPLWVAMRRGWVPSRRHLPLAGAVAGTIAALLLAPHLRSDLITIPFPWWMGAATGFACGEVAWRVMARVR